MREITPPQSPGSLDVASPCVRNCCLDETDVCLGCGRLLSEILAWRAATIAEREVMLELAAQRRSARDRWTRGT